MQLNTYHVTQYSEPSYIPESIRTDFSSTEYAKDPGPISVMSEPMSEMSSQSGIEPFKDLRGTTQTDPSMLITDDEVDPEFIKELTEDSVKKYAEFREMMLKDCFRRRGPIPSLGNLRNVLTKLEQ
ncbi:uncharacterized protein LOC143204754 [Rhynchophorus ferrugineus]|uniref:uncharacterized protein LOC143204754 n=1 Tax=Rhynchophorus ferrugineus TaxID=354439 RepID=UPI003FCE7F6D